MVLQSTSDGRVAAHFRILKATLDQVEKALRALAAYPKEVERLAQTLASFGIRFVVVEPLAGSRIDGAAFWLSNNDPVIAYSARLDRIDALWFTIFAPR